MMRIILHIRRAVQCENDGMLEQRLLFGTLQPGQTEHGVYGARALNYL